MEFTDRDKDRVRNLINFVPSQSGLFFFSEKNIDNLNTQIKKYILKMTQEKYGQKIMINSQKRSLMLSVMRYVYLQHNQTHYVLDFELPEFLQMVRRTMLGGSMAVSRCHHVRFYILLR